MLQCPASFIITVTSLLFGIMLNKKDQTLSCKSQDSEGDHENTCVKAVTFCDFLLLLETFSLVLLSL